jgi:hypothetical protein
VVNCVIYSRECYNFRVPLPDGDIIRMEIQGGVPPEPDPTSPTCYRDVVEFVLWSVRPATWWKGLRVPDGEGRSWEITTQDNEREDRVRLWSHQVNHWQYLTFRKAKFLGVHTAVYTLGGLDRLRPGQRVNFVWERDNVGWPGDTKPYST